MWIKQGITSSKNAFQTKKKSNRFHTNIWRNHKSSRLLFALKRSKIRPWTWTKATQTQRRIDFIWTHRRHNAPSKVKRIWWMCPNCAFAGVPWHTSFFKDVDFFGEWSPPQRKAYQIALDHVKLKPCKFACITLDGQINLEL